jgi:hypothetical protein
MLFTGASGGVAGNYVHSKRIAAVWGKSTSPNSAASAGKFVNIIQRNYSRLFFLASTRIEKNTFFYTSPKLTSKF